MKNIKRIILFSIAIALFILIFSPNVSNASTTIEVNTEDNLLEAINTATAEDIIKLTTNIELTKPLGIAEKTITINGNKYTISRDIDNWSVSGPNASLITAGIGSKVTLMNLNLKNAQKYGAQAYNGGYLVLDNVSISNCNFGGVLVNAGTLEIRNLFLDKNGQASNNGIEIAKSSTISESANEPTIIMNGTLSSSQQENVIYLAVNDALATFKVTNTVNTVNKIFGQSNKVVVTDKNNNIIFASNTSAGLDIDADVYTEPTVIPEKDPSPKTGLEDYLGIPVLVIVASILGIVTLKRKEF